MDRAVDVDLLVRNGWAIALRGLLASAFGSCVLLARDLPMPALVIAYGMYSVVDGIFAVFVALQRRRPNEAPRWAYLLVGAAAIVPGLVMLLWSAMTVALLVYLVAASAVASGLAQFAGALRLRQQVRGEWWLALGGMVALAFGIAAVALPVGSTTLATWVSGYRLFDGAILGALALRLHSWEKKALPQATAEAPADPVIDVSLEPKLEVMAELEVEVEVVAEPVAEALPTHAMATPSAE